MNLTLKTKAAAVFLLLLAGLCAAHSFASDGTVSKPWRETFRVYDILGGGRNNCSLSRFSALFYRDLSPVSLTPGFRNFTAAGTYAMTVTPAAAGDYVCFLSYSGTDIGQFTKTVKGSDTDTIQSRVDGGFPNISTMVQRDYASAAKDSTTMKSAAFDAYTSRLAIPATFDNASTVDARLTLKHGSGFWTAAGSVTILPFQGSASHETVTQGRDVHVVRGDSAVVPYSIGKDIGGWTVWFGAKAAPGDEPYAVPLREITGYVTDSPTGAGLIDLATSDTALPPRRYQAEVEIRRGPEVLTPLKFNLWIDPDVIR